MPHLQLFQKSDKPPPHPRSPNRNNMPHPYYARFIRDNVRFLNQPVSYVGTASTGHKQTEWWPTNEESVTPHKPSYDRTTIQRSDYGRLSFSSHQTRHGCNPHKTPLSGIVPLASPRGRHRLPKLFQEEISFFHQYDSRLTPSEPIRGKRHGGFVWKEIKTESDSGVPQGTKLFLNAKGSHTLQQAQTERGNSVESCMTSPSACEFASQQMLHSKAHLSKTELWEASKPNPSIPARDPCSIGASQTPGRKVLAPIADFKVRLPSADPK
ncbi:ciliary microtubule inner protein 6 [Gastrophryne carolinensis]